jgi:hypothetical protein
MIIFDEKTEPIMLDNIDIPFPVEYFWALDLELMDFTLKELKLSEELTTKTITVTVNGWLLEAPADWNILTYSKETSQLDVVTFSDLTKYNFSVFVYDHKQDKLIDSVVRALDYDPCSKVQTPSLVRNTMLCHPLGYDSWACIAPTDSYNKYLKNTVIGDIL